MKVWKKIKIIHMDGGITIFLSLILLSILALIGTVTESARVAVAKQKVKSVQTQAMQSAFSYYAKEVFDEYGIFLLWETKEGVNNQFRKFIDKSLVYDKDSVFKSMDMLGIKVNATDFSGVQYATDEKGILIANQICEFMKYQVTEDIINQFSSDANSSTQGVEVSELMQEVSDETSTFQETELLVGNIQEALEEELGINQDSVRYLQELESLVEVIIKNNTENAVEDFIIKYQAFKVDWIKQKEYLVHLIGKSEEYENRLSGVIQSFYDWKDTYMQGLYKYSAEIQSIAKDEINDVEQVLCNQEQDSYGIMENKVRMEVQYAIICQIEIIIKDIVQNEGNLKQYLNNQENCESAVEVIKKAMILAEDINFSEFQINYPSQVVHKEDVSFLEQVKQILSNSWLVLVTDTISAKKLEESELLITNKSKEYDVDLWKTQGTIEKLKNRALLSVYLKKHFPNYISEDDRREYLLEYQMEYILGGYCSDRENLEHVVKRLFAIRTGYNLLYLQKDIKSRKEANILAMSVVGFTGMPAAVKVAELSILSIWAQAEAIVDIRNLLLGKCVPLLKKNKDWNLELRSLGTAFQKNSKEKLDMTPVDITKENIEIEKTEKGDIVKEDKKKENKDGLGYAEYLQMLLLKEDTGTLTIRAMSLIQLNIQQRYNTGFMIEKCIVGGTAKIYGRIPRLFTSLGFINDNIQSSDTGFEIQSQVMFQY